MQQLQLVFVPCSTGLLDRWQFLESISGYLQISMLIAPAHCLRWGILPSNDNKHTLSQLILFPLLTLFFCLNWVWISVLWWLAKSICGRDQGMHAFSPLWRIFWVQCILVVIIRFNTWKSTTDCCSHLVELVSWMKAFYSTSLLQFLGIVYLT